MSDNEDPSATRLFNGSRQFNWKGGWYTTRELYDHPDRTGQLTYKQFTGRMPAVRKGEYTLDWAMTRDAVRIKSYREVDVVYLGPHLGAEAQPVGQFNLALQGGETPARMARRAIGIASHQGTIRGVYLVSMQTKHVATTWIVRVDADGVGTPRPYEDDLDEGVTDE